MLYQGRFLSETVSGHGFKVQDVRVGLAHCLRHLLGWGGHFTEFLHAHIFGSKFRISRWCFHAGSGSTVGLLRFHCAVFVRVGLLHRRIHTLSISLPGFLLLSAAFESVILNHMTLLEESQLCLFSTMFDVSGACFLAKVAVAVGTENVAELLWPLENITMRWLCSLVVLLHARQIGQRWYLGTFLFGWLTECMEGCHGFFVVGWPLLSITALRNLQIKYWIWLIQSPYICIINGW